jgi:hypothetical protein
LFFCTAANIRFICRYSLEGLQGIGPFIISSEADCSAIGFSSFDLPAFEQDVMNSIKLIIAIPKGFNTILFMLLKVF